jgi:hypothetical protein
MVLPMTKATNKVLEGEAEIPFSSFWKRGVSLISLFARDPQFDTLQLNVWRLGDSKQYGFYVGWAGKGSFATFGIASIR